MSRGPLYLDAYAPQFSGHETFPLRYGWLKKVYDRVSETESEGNNKNLCWGDDAIARFGVGKNMVGSMRHWAKVTGIIEETPSENSVRTTSLADFLFGSKGFDPYMEYPTTLWLIHWRLAAHPEKTTWFWLFSHFPALTFERESLAKGLRRLAKNRGWARAAKFTIKNDVACCIRTYVARQPTGKIAHDDALESPLTELGLIKAVGKKDGFRFVRGPKSTLGDGVFIYALLDFWSSYSSAATLSFEAIAHAPGGPGRVFVFDENDVSDRLAVLDDVTKGELRWSEAAGLKQVVRNVELDEDLKRSYLLMDYGVRRRRRSRNAA